MPGNIFAGGSAPQTSQNPQPQGGNIFASGPAGGSEFTPQSPQSQSVEMPEPELPAGAVSFDPNGQPYFGDGIPGILKKWKWNFTKDVKDVDDAAWNDLKARWKESTSKTDATTEEFNAEQLEQVGMVGEAISKGWQEMTASAQGSVLSPVLKGVGASVVALGELFSIPAQKIEQGAGALQGLREAAREVDNPLLPRLEANPLTDMLESTPLGIAYDFTRIALSSNDNKWSFTQKKIEEGWQAGRILYSQLFNDTLKQQFLAEYRNGGDPALIAMKLQNPLAELGGQLIFDPLNAVGAFGKASKTAAQLNAVEKSLTASGLLKLESGTQALKAVQDAQDEVGAIRALDTLVTAQREAVDLVQGQSKLLNRTWGVNDLTTSSRQGAIIAKGKELLGNMALVLKENGMGYDGIAEAVMYGAKSVSKNADEMKQGLSAIAALPNSNMWLSDDYIETFTMVNKLLDDGTGVLTGARLKKLMDVANPAEFADEAAKMMAGAAKSEFPDVSELRSAWELSKKADKGEGLVSTKTAEYAKMYEALPNHVKTLNSIDRAFSKIRNPINNTLGKFYFNLQGGVAVKNIASNFELVALDKGVGAWFKDGKYWSAENVTNFLKDIYGDLPQSASGFGGLAKDAAGGDKALLFGKLMEWGEQRGALRVVGASVRDTFKAMIPKSLPNLSKEIEAGVLTEKQAQKLSSLLLRNNGNVPKALDQFRELYKLGAVEEWRNLDYVSDFERNGLEGMGYWDEIEDLAQRGAVTQEEVTAVFDKIRKSIDSRSELATRDVIGLSTDHPSAETWGDLMKAVEDGHLDPGQQQVFTAIMESAEQARLEYQTLLDDVALKAMDALQQEGRLPEAQRIGQEMNRVRETLRKAAPATARETREMTQDAWRWTEAIRKEKTPTPDILSAYWSKAGLPSPAPLDLTKQSLLKEIWKQRFDNVSRAWNGSMDAIFAESETVLQQMGSVVDATELQAMAARTRQMTQQAQTLRGATFEKGLLKIKPTPSLAEMAKRYGIASATESGVPKDKQLLSTINKYSDKQFKTLQEAQTDMPTVERAFKNRAAAKGTKPLTQTTGGESFADESGELLTPDLTQPYYDDAGNLIDPGIAVPPPHPLGAQPSPARVWNESAKGAKYALDRIQNEIMSRWGKTDNARQIDANMESVLARISSEVTPRMAEMKAIALRIADQQREFTLLNYGKKTYGDIMASYVFPYHFYYTRSTKNWISRVATDPEIMAGYGKYKDSLENANRDLPDWYKQQLNLNPLTGREDLKGKKILGIPVDHPLYFNLEATFNPMYGLTGTDFQDPAKRTDWATATFDDMSKFGPTTWAPIQMAIAAKLFMDGETDAASRWGNRIIPQTAQFKAVTSIFGKPVELDPAVQLFSGKGLFDTSAMDPYERGRMGYSAAQLIESGQFTAEEVQEQFQMGEGPAWEAARQMAVESRAASSISSYFLGVGFKPRSTNDVTVEEMMTDLNKLYAMSDNMTSEQFRNEYEKIRSAYPDGLLDTVLLAKKGGPKRDAAYAYSVLGRLPPGEMSDVFNSIGISQKDISKFYESKGFTNKGIQFTATEQSRFMAAIVDLGAMLAIPEDATRAEWNEARNVYGQLNTYLKKQYGDDIFDKITHYYDLKDDNRDQAEAFKQQHPEVMAALSAKSEAVISTPALSAYYGGIDTIESYVFGKVRQQLSDKYGADIYNIQSQYFAAPNQKAFLSQHPELRKFWTDKKKLDAEAEVMFKQFASNLPEMQGAEFREGFTPSSGVQETLYQNLQPQGQIPQWQELSQGMPSWLQQEVAAYWQSGKQPSKRAKDQLDYMASQKGFYDYKDFLRTAGLSYQQFQKSPQAFGP